MFTRRNRQGNKVERDIRSLFPQECCPCVEKCSLQPHRRAATRVSLTQGCVLRSSPVWVNPWLAALGSMPGITQLVCHFKHLG